MVLLEEIYLLFHKNVIFAYNNSTQLQYTKKYLPRDVIDFDDILV